MPWDKGWDRSEKGSGRCKGVRQKGMMAQVLVTSDDSSCQLSWPLIPKPENVCALQRAGNLRQFKVISDPLMAKLKRAGTSISNPAFVKLFLFGFSDKGCWS